VRYYPLPALVAAALVTGAACSGEAGGRAPRRHVVEISGFAYDPATLEMAAGDTVVWINRDAVPHTATSADGEWDTGSIAPGASWIGVLPEGVQGGYTCTFHPTMKGQVSSR
jgi:plastocyanin